MEICGTGSTETAWPAAKVPDRDAGKPGLLRQGRATAATGQQADPAGGVPESGILQGPGDALSGMGQASRHRLCGKLSQTHSASSRVPGRRQGAAE